ncbi:MAG TPA: hypothetical protein PLU30_15285 [Verrucomicrobiae bacterium]|nr:hypothetical protein [Verrucomicrobiae bacterium]
METQENEKPGPETLRARHVAAAALSIIPGLGHLYKGHVGLGLLFMFGIMLIIFISVMMIWATAFTSLVIIPAIYWIAVGAHAFAAEDLRAEHKIGV